MSMFKRGRQAVYVCILTAVLAACSAQTPSWRIKTAPLVEELGRNEAPELFSQEYRSLLDTYEHGEALYHVRKDDKGADAYYQLAFQKAEMLQTEVVRVQKQRAAEKQRRIDELAAKVKEEQRLRAAAEAEAKAELRRQAAQAAIAAEAAQSSVKKSRNPLPGLPTSYTVRRGETLPQISARSEIYNDSTLWPIIFRANRDQIRDPKRLWPGQVFAIPRNFSRNDADEARRYAARNGQK
ncbi:MAG TPA: LysM peptidoglycan-binding domain-containing protein [Desulfuromonadales bacterium]|nr:LysM peptidoglycan-binding domain-containing protein [Desulfuromonadales bacterium]